MLAGPDRLVLEITEDEQSAVVRAFGEIDLDSSPQLRDELRRLTHQGLTAITVDLEHVSFMDSTGLGVLARALRRARQTGAKLTLRSLQPAVRSILEITQLTTVFTIEE